MVGSALPVATGAGWLAIGVGQTAPFTSVSHARYETQAQLCLAIKNVYDKERKNKCKCKKNMTLK